MRTIVLGGTGFFGKELVEILLNEGHHVTLLTRGNKALKDHPLLRPLKADRYDLDSLKAALGDETFDVAFDQLGFCSNDAKILCEALEGKIKHLVFTSTKSVYDYGTELSEESVDPKNYTLKIGGREDFDYGEGKRQAEAYLAQKAPFTVGMFRPPVVIGEGDTSDRWNWHMNRIREGKEIYFPNLEAYFCVLASKDAGQALYKMSVDKTEGPLNFYTANPKLSEILSLMEEGAGKRALLAKEPREGNHSPYGIEKDWFMSRAKADSLGFSSQVDFHSLAQTLSHPS